jgi:hypothetical protein
LELGKLAGNFSVSSGLQLRFSKYVKPVQERSLGPKAFQLCSLAYNLALKYGITEKFNTEKQ